MSNITDILDELALQNAFESYYILQIGTIRVNKFQLSNQVIEQGMIKMVHDVDNNTFDLYYSSTSNIMNPIKIELEHLWSTLSDEWKIYLDLHNYKFESNELNKNKKQKNATIHESIVE